MIVLYSEVLDHAVEAVFRDAVAPMLSRRASSRDKLVEELDQVTVAVVALPSLRCEEADWLRNMVSHRPGPPSWIVVTPLSIGAVQQSRALSEHEGFYFYVVWAEEAADRLALVVERMSAESPYPMWTLGRRIVGNPELRPRLRDVVSHICRLEIGITYTPSSDLSNDVLAGLARQGDVRPGHLRDALASSPSPDGRSEQLVGWSLLLAACESASKLRGSGTAPMRLESAHFPIGTLSRCAARLLGWSLQRALRSPREVRSRFAEWRSESQRFGSSHPPPPTTVRDLSKLWFYDTATLRRVWGTELPLRCRSKRLLAWSMLFWALGQRRREQPWHQVAKRAQCQRRTLERYSRQLAGCGLQAAAMNPSLASRAFWTWVNESWTGQ